MYYKYMRIFTIAVILFNTTFHSSGMEWNGMIPQPTRICVLLLILQLFRF